MSVPTLVKSAAGAGLAAIYPHCRFDRAVFLIGHMRCGSTAVSNILVSRPEISGYGEAHVAYDRGTAMGELALNQMRRGGWKAGAPSLFDKILHDRYDAQPHPDFFRARALFVARKPEDAVLSIRSLFEALGSPEYATDAAAAAYYSSRLATMLALHARFPVDRRFAVSHAEIVADPERVLARVSDFLAFDPPLSNQYVATSRKGRGAGDPLQSHNFTRIEGGERASGVARQRRPLELCETTRAQLSASYARFLEICRV